MDIEATIVSIRDIIYRIEAGEYENASREK